MTPEENSSGCPCGLKHISSKAGLWRNRYKYRSEDGRHYILAFHDIGFDGIRRAKWTKYTYGYEDYEEQEQEHITVSEEFHKMLDSEYWENEGFEIVPSK